MSFRYSEKHLKNSMLIDTKQNVPAMVIQNVPVKVKRNVPAKKRKPKTNPITTGQDFRTNLKERIKTSMLITIVLTTIIIEIVWLLALLLGAGYLAYQYILPWFLI